MFLFEIKKRQFINILYMYYLLLGSLVGSLYSVSYQFIGATPDYWCHIEELVEANWTVQDIKNISIPYE